MSTADGPVVGVDVGGTKILARTVDPRTGAAGKRVKVATPTDGPDAVLAATIETIKALDGYADATAVGVGLPGMVVGANTVTSCANIAGWDHPIAVGDEIASALGRPVVVANDVNCGAVAEHRLGAGRGCADMLAVFVGTGVGGGLILDNALVEGGRGLTGEIGHVTVVPDGRPCAYGRGCLEAYAGRAGMERQARELAAAGRPNRLVELAGSGAMKSRHFERAIEEGDEVAVELLAEAAWALALVIGNMATMLDLQRVVLGGGVVDKFGQTFLDQIVASPTFGGFGPDVCELHLAERLDDAGVVGAAMLASDQRG
ncbi:MAG: ROK family protein [Actinomycetota bacterium]